VGKVFPTSLVFLFRRKADNSNCKATLTRSYHGGGLSELNRKRQMKCRPSWSAFELRFTLLAHEALSFLLLHRSNLQPSLSQPLSRPYSRGTSS
jgi:hypothetical protein